MENKLADLDIAITAHSTAEYDRHVLNIFEKIRNNLPDGADIYLHKQSLKTGTKWVLKGSGARRPIDFFRIWTPANILLHRFHLNIVKFWYDGKRIKALCSGVCAALTGVNQWYKWFSNNKDPMSIVLKNMQRGYTTLLNEKEIEALKIYITEVNQYKHIANNFIIGKIHQHHSIFGHEGGIRYEFPLLVNTRCHINDSQYWEEPDYNLPHLNCTLKVSQYGKLIMPNIHMFETIIKDALH
jgi:hypothetical protein